MASTQNLSLRSKFDAVKSLAIQHQKFLPALFFLIGFLFDLLTLGRIDQSFGIFQQAVFLILLGMLLCVHLIHQQTPLQPKSKALQWLLSYHLLILHFLFGSLLSAYTIFYFKSSSLVVSFAFILILVSLLVANEFDFFKRLGVGVKLSLYSLCLMSYFAYLVPILIGSTGTFIFILSMLLACLPIGLIFWFLQRKGLNKETLLRQIFRPTALILISFLLLYLTRILPPVPLSIKFISIYHEVERNSEGQYLLSHQKPWWNFWHHGDENFKAQAGDRIYVFFRLFSPTNFEDKVYLRWLHKHPKWGWSPQDKIPITITGGRAQGFRGFGFKSNYSPGDWRVLVETAEGLEIGRISFEVTLQEFSERQFNIDYQ